MLLNPVDALLGTTTKVRLLRALLPLSSPVSGREAERLAGTRSSRASRQALEDLVSLGVLHRAHVGRTHLYEVNPGHDLVGPLQALFTAEAGRMERLWDAVAQAVHGAGCSEEVRGVILFGSNARGEAGPESDVDLLVATSSDRPDPHLENALREAETSLRESTGLSISAYVVPAERIRERYRAGDPLMMEIERDGRRLFGDSFEEILRW